MSAPGERSSFGATDPPADRLQDAHRAAEALLRAETDRHAFAAARLEEHLAAIPGLDVLGNAAARAHCQLLADVALELGARDTALGGLLLSMRELQTEDAALRARLTERRAVSHRSAEDLAAREDALAALQAEVGRAQGAVQAAAGDAPQRAAEMDTLQTKRQEYLDTLAAAPYRNTAPTVTHSSLLALLEDCHATTLRVEAKELRLQVYLGLPLDPALAELKVEEAKAELLALQQQFHSMVELLQL